MYTPKLKFRVWDGEQMHFASFQEYLEGFGCTFNSVIKPKSVMQFTGLIDANGNEIYSGDLIHSPDISDSLFEVVWNDYEAEFLAKPLTCIGACLPNILGTLYYVTKYHNDAEYRAWWKEANDRDMNMGEMPFIIGNVFEDPKLIEQCNEKD